MTNKKVPIRVSEAVVKAMNFIAENYTFVA